MAELYWIRTATMTNLKSEGYVGISTISAAKRWKGHITASRDKSKAHLPLYRAMIKYGPDKLVLEVIMVGDNDFILEMETKLRPIVGIGWNCAQGGQATGKGRKHSPETVAKSIASRKGYKHSIETKAKQSAASKGKPKSESHKINIGLSKIGSTHTEEWRLAHSKCMKGRTGMISDEGRKRISDSKKAIKPWNHSKSNSVVWSLAMEVFDLYINNSNVSMQTAGKQFGMTYWAFRTVLKDIRSGWNPREDLGYQQWLAEINNKENYAT